MTDRNDDLARLRAVIDQLDELTTRLGTSSSTEVDMSLLERAAELADEAARLLEGLAGETTT
ncbi:MAG TPA: hypothetical protein PLT83_07225 [Thermoleophilia bacterium]|nr:hypothetical protein [Thermoleophilia bacterium]HQG55263.1 hypothetical protein [Thermoleophilia bacterium]